MAADRWEAVAAFDAATLHALLADGRPEQRVWAIWALAMQAGASIGELVQRTAREPHPGVRRQLAIVLAGHGEHDLVVALGRHDPATEVRAAAMQLVTRVAATGAIDVAVVTESFAREGSAVRGAILGAIERGAPAPLVALAAGAFADPDPDLQLEAFELMIRLDSPADLATAIRWIAKAPGPIAARAWRRWGELVAAPALVGVLVRTPLAVRTHAVRALDTLPIGDLAALTGGADLRMFDAIRARSDFATAPAELLARGVLAGAAVDYVRALTATRATLSPDLTAQLRAYCTHKLAALGPVPPDDDEVDEWSEGYAYLALQSRIG